jgi:peptidoglycan/xylan/chitin deacetylase (PgdA/CDA1 family)
MAASGDGRWLLYVEPVTAAFGNLVLINTLTGLRTLISPNMERPDLNFPACWSPDSRVFIYNRGGRLYYHTINAPGFPVDERYRLIGEGSINSVYWGKAGDFFYIRGSTVYRVRGSDLFARSIYADFLEIGTVAGKIPFEFDYNFDAFWVAPDLKFLLLSKGGRNIFYYPLGVDDYDSPASASLPYIMLPRSGFNLSVLWSPRGVITVTASAGDTKGSAVVCYRIDPFRAGNGGGTGEDGPAGGFPGGSAAAFPCRSPAALPGPNAALSPDGTLAVLWGDGGAALYDYADWRPLETLSVNPVYSCLWTGNDELILGDQFRIERLRIGGRGNSGNSSPGVSNAPSRSLVCIASAAEFGFEEKGDRIFARSGDRWFATNGNDPWTEVGRPGLRRASLVSGRYRVYLEKQISGPYENLPMIRNIASVGTSPLLPPVVYITDSPAPEGPGEGEGPEGLFTHARRGGLREAGLCFDLYDDAAGLTEVLDALRRFGIRATFFLNGEFIRRHPGAAGDIAAAGHETASMFFAPIDLSDARYRIEEDFVSRGLARNEDEFFRAAGAELSLIWHAPYYAVSSELIAAAAAAGYRTIGRDVDPLDWVGREDSKRISIPQYSASEMIDRIMDRKRPGSIIPIRLGLLPGGRSDYLFSRINVLLDALVRSGYSIVPVSTLIEHAR